ncbi:MAG: LptE family protein, partial [Bdellovibrionales bacterium]
MFFFLALPLGTSGCAYRLGLSERALPGGYSEIAIPVFDNRSGDVGIEMYFTNALIRRFARSQVARVVDKEDSPLVLEGAIVKVETIAGPAQTDQELQTLPEGAVLTTEYRVVVHTSIVLRRRSDEKIIWQGGFSNERVYPAPRIGESVLNSANATYNHSARLYEISRLAEDMME